MVSARQLYEALTAQLNAAGIPDAAFDVRCMLEQMAERPFPQLMLSDSLTQEQADKLCEMAEERQKGHPLQYLLGEWEFYGLRMFVGEGVLIPRPDTETLVDAALEFCKTLRNPQIADLCSGSGCIPIALKANLPQAHVHAVEWSEQALGYLRRNAAYHNSDVEIHHADVLDERFARQFSGLDLIVSNPPYLTAQDMQNLQTEVQFEPEMALLGGEDGLHFYREITKIWKHSLKNGGMLAFEVGIGQSQAVRKILEEHQFTDIRIIPDLAGVERVAAGRKIF
ncbi:MAG: peptide chain release factor N(5)-glutamine methyltransferase [Ruminococcus sp.]|nr:peptide chain release factor N(5)-glutamine methyltransferase [Ruminococcus sp.]